MTTDTYSKTVFGFWIYLLTDFVLFATILSTYFVLRDSTYGGPVACDLLPLSFTLMQTLILLFCSFITGLADVAAHHQSRGMTIFLFSLTFLLGFLFLWMEYAGCTHLINQGFGWDKSAFLSAYFTLIGTHGLHMIFALLWILVLLSLVWKRGLSSVSLQRLTCLRMFWQFLNVIWIGIVTMVYLMGVS